MTCTKCGSAVAPGSAFCPVCNEPLAYVQQPVYQQQPYQPQQQVYQQSYVQYQQPTYPTGYQQPYGYGRQPVPDTPTFLDALSDLPRSFAACFSRPGDVLRGMMEKRDLISGAIVAVLVLVLAFLGGMVVMRSFVDVIFRVVGTLTGASLAGDAAAMNQGVSYVAGRVAPAVGGIAALCQLIGMVVPTTVFMVYLCAMCRMPFSWPLVIGFFAVTTLPTAAVALLAMVLSLLSPWLGVLAIVCGMVVSYTQACAMLSYATGRSEGQLTLPKMCCVVISVALVLVLCGLFGGLLMGQVLQRVLVLLGSVGSLI